MTKAVSGPAVPPSDHDIIHALADNLPVGLWVARAPTGEFVYSNRMFAEIMGQTGRDDVAVGEYSAPYGIMTRDGAPYPEHRMPFVRALQERQVVVVDDLSIHRPDGTKVDVRAFAQPVTGADGDITHVVICFFDITREVAAETAQKESELRLHRAQRLEAIGTLAGGIAHDFNNLIFGVKLVAAELANSEPDPERRAQLELIDGITERSAGLTRSLLGFARRSRHRAAPVMLDDVIAQMRALLERTLSEIAITFELGADRRGTIVGDESQLEQVVMNLVVNARDAGSNAVVVRTRSDAGHVVLEVIDNGGGIAAELRERVFEPYFTTKEQGAQQGTGLGLATVLGIVEGHGGTIAIDDGLDGSGTTMRLRFPAALFEIKKTRPATAVGEGTGRPNGSGRILVVDDDQLTLRALAGMLRSLGYEAVVATSGSEAVEVYRRDPAAIHAVVLDMIMPGMTGPATYAALRAIDPEVAVLGMSGSATAVDAQALLDDGVRAFMAKPYAADALARVLAEITAPPP